MSLAPDSERAFTFGSFSLLGIHLRPRLLLPYWLVGTAARDLSSHFSFFLFLWSLSHSGDDGKGAGGCLPIGLFLFQFWGCPASALAVAGNGGRVLRAHLSSGRLTGACSRLFSSPLTLPGVITTFRVCLPRAPALRQMLEAMLAEGALESPSVLVLAFHSSLFLVRGSSDGSATGDRFLYPGWMCLNHSVPVEFSHYCAVSV